MNNTDFTSRESEGETIFYDANQTWQKIEGQLGDFVLKCCGDRFGALALKKAEQRYFVKLREALKFKEAIKITLNGVNLVALQRVKFKIKIKNKTFFTALHGMEHTVTQE